MILYRLLCIKFLYLTTEIHLCPRKFWIQVVSTYRDFDISPLQMAEVYCFWGHLATYKITSNTALKTFTGPLLTETLNYAGELTGMKSI